MPAPRGLRDLARPLSDDALAWVPRPERFTSPVHDTRVATRIGRWLGPAFLVCFLTGLLSHVHQHPVSWFPLGPTPSWGYRVTQGLHVATGTAAVPLLLAKLHAVYPKLFERPLVGGPRRVLERVSVLLLVGSALFQLSTGFMNVVQWYAWGFFFTTVHYAVAWVAIGSVVLHVAVQLPAIRRTWRAPVPAAVEQPAEGRTAADATRRTFLVGTGATVLATTVLTVGQTLRPLAALSVLAPRDPRVGPQGVPVNRTPAEAGVSAEATGSSWRLTLRGPGGEQQLSQDALRAMDQRTESLPVTCVEGWSADATWTGVPVRALAALVGGGHDDALRVTSLEESGAYRVTLLPASYVRDPRTLLALDLGGEPLALAHGAPARVMAPDRPGVLQTKWVDRLEVVPGGVGSLDA